MEEDADNRLGSFCKADPEILPIVIGTPDNPAGRQGLNIFYFIEH